MEYPRINIYISKGEGRIDISSSSLLNFDEFQRVDNPAPRGGGLLAGKSYFFEL